MSVVHHKITVPRTAHYFQLNELSDETVQCWIVFHGYGQLASSIIHKFSFFSNRKDVCVIAPEGLSYFYWGGLSGDVVSSWMTKHHRLDEIADQQSFLNLLLNNIRAKIPTKCQLNILSFSQGTATAWRWVVASKIMVDRFITWAGTLPPELTYEEHIEWLNNINHHYVHGNQDPFFDDLKMNDVRSFIEARNLKVKWHTFNGGHKVDRELLQNLVDRVGE